MSEELKRAERFAVLIAALSGVFLAVCYFVGILTIAVKQQVVGAPIVFRPEGYSVMLMGGMVSFEAGLMACFLAILYFTFMPGRLLRRWSKWKQAETDRDRVVLAKLDPVERAHVAARRRFDSVLVKATVSVLWLMVAALLMGQRAGEVQNEMLRNCSASQPTNPSPCA